MGLENAMGLRYWIDAPARTARLEAVGETTPEEWTTAMRAILKNPAYRPGFGFLSDRRAAPAASVAYTENALGFVMIKQKQLVGARFAVVVSDPASLEMARLGQRAAQSASLPILAEIFQDIDAAACWLRSTAPER